MGGVFNTGDYFASPTVGPSCFRLESSWVSWCRRRPGSGSPTRRRCLSGHTLGPDQVLVGHHACLGHGGEHTTWACRTCDQTVYGPALNTHCTALDGPGTVRISNARSKIPRGGRLIGSLLVEDEVFDGPGHFHVVARDFHDDVQPGG